MQQAFETLFKLYNIKINKILNDILILYATTVLFLVMSVEYSNLYYVSVDLIFGKDFNYIVKEYGPLHALYPSMMILYVILLARFLGRCYAE
mgnify:CR=1 FL=1